MKDLDLKNGVWLITTIKDGNHYKYIAESVEDLPNMATKLQIEPYRYQMANNVLDYLTPIFNKGPVYPNAIKVDKIMQAVFAALEG